MQTTETCYHDQRETPVTIDMANMAKIKIQWSLKFYKFLTIITTISG